ncbi:MAG: glycosyltransferase family 2 protein [Actinomycetota bacterium]
MSELPQEVIALLKERDHALSEKDYTRADEIRARIDALGFTVQDSPSGATAVPKPKYSLTDPAHVTSSLNEPPTTEFSIHVLYEGFKDDLIRFIDSFTKHCTDFEIVITEALSSDADWIESLASDHVRTIHLSSDPGWGAARNAAIKQSRGAIIVIADLSVEATGDLLTPLNRAFKDPDVGVAGPWGITTTNLRDFEAAKEGEVDAIEGYFLATTRDIVARVLIDEKFRWYRHADIEYSFRIRDLGYKAVVTDDCAIRHTHRAWTALEGDSDKREKLSKKNFNRFLDRFRERTDLLTHPM